MAKILAPNKQYTGVSAGVVFVNGAGETDNPALIIWFKEKGYIVETQEDSGGETEIPEAQEDIAPKEKSKSRSKKED